MRDTDGSAAAGGGRSRWPVAIGIGVLAVLLLGAGGVWWYLRDDAPEAVTLDDAVRAAQGDGSGTTGGTTTDGSDGTSTGSADPTGVSGTWQVDTTIGEFNYEEATATFVGFRVEEELTTVGSTTAVGRTPEVSGTLTIDGTTVSAVTVEADLSALTTDTSQRDGAVQRTLETDQFPTATFTLTEPIDLGDDALSGAPVSVEATGDLTIHGRTRTVTMPLQATLVGDVIAVTGSTDIVFADYGVDTPSAPIVVSVRDQGTLELLLLFTR